MHGGKLNRGRALATRGRPRDLTQALEDVRAGLPDADDERRPELDRIVAALEKRMRK